MPTPNVTPLAAATTCKIAEAADKRAYEIIDTLEGDKIVDAYPTHRCALNATRKLEPVETMPDNGWRYQIRKATAR